MSLVYSEEQQLLADTAAEFLMAKSPVTAQRKLRDEGASGGSADGFDAALWREMVDLGWSAIPFPEALGGLEFGCKGLGAVFEQIGRNLSASPLLSSIVLGGAVQHRREGMGDRRAEHRRPPGRDAQCWPSRLMALAACLAA